MGKFGDYSLVECFFELHQGCFVALEAVQAWRLTLPDKAREVVDLASSAMAKAGS